MHNIDRLILVNVVNQLDKALAELKSGGPVGEVMTGLWIKWAQSDLKAVLETNPAKEEV